MVSRLKSRVRAALHQQPYRIPEAAFFAPDIIHRDDALDRKARLAGVVGSAILPRLVALHSDVLPEPDGKSPSQAEIVELAHLVLSPKLQAAAEYVTILRERGLPMETLFVELLQPAAQHLGRMWENDECDFVDVSLGVGQLQLLLAIFNCTHELPAIGQLRRAYLTLTPGEHHVFGIEMVAKLLRAAGWSVTIDTAPTLDTIVGRVSQDWHAVAGVTLSSDLRIEHLTETVTAIRRYSSNPSIGIMVGGSKLVEHPELTRKVGADATAINATTAVILAQKLFDLGAKSNWQGTGPVAST